MTECLYSLMKNFGNKDSGANPVRGHSDRFKYGISEAMGSLSQVWDFFSYLSIIQQKSKFVS